MVLAENVIEPQDLRTSNGGSRFYGDEELTW
jgi:hypothetical protein